MILDEKHLIYDGTCVRMLLESSHFCVETKYRQCENTFGIYNLVAELTSGIDSLSVNYTCLPLYHIPQTAGRRDAFA